MGAGETEEEEEEEQAGGSGTGGANSWSMTNRAKTLPLLEDLLEGAPTEPRAARRGRGREEEGKTIRRGNRERKGESPEAKNLMEGGWRRRKGGGEGRGEEGIEEVIVWKRRLYMMTHFPFSAHGLFFLSGA